MPYCRRCGTQLEENARFCHRCGIPVDPYAVPPVQQQPVYYPPAYQQVPPPQAQTKPHRPMYKDPIVIGTVALVVILLTAVVIGAFMIAPINPWSYNNSQSNQNPDLKTLNLNFHTNVGQVNVMTLEIGDRNVLISVQGNGSYGFLGGSAEPVTFTFDNQTVGDTLTVNSQINVDESATERSNVAVQIFIDPALALNLNVSSSTGKVSFVADKATTLQSLYLESTTGEVEANLQGNLTITGDITLKSSTADVNFRLSQDAIEGNRTVNLESSTGSVVADLTQTKAFNGNLHVNAATTTGSVNVGLTIDGAVAAKITSHTGTFGGIKTNHNNFQGNNTNLQTLNYPSTCNIEVNNTVGTGDINITADYLTTLIYS